jgi:DNA-binding CsgD family transcriptional regulator
MGKATGALFERSGEIERIRDALGRARSGRGGFLSVEGAAGMGRSALLGEATALGRRRRFRVLSARAANPAAATASAPLPLPDLDGAEATIADLDAATGPTLAAIDDAQWCDEATLRDLIALAPRIDRAPVLVLLAVRAGEPGRGDLLAALATEPNAETIELRPLSEDGVAELLASQHGAPPAPGLAAECHRWTGGVPALVVAVADRFGPDAEPPSPGATPALPLAGADRLGPDAGPPSPGIAGPVPPRLAADLAAWLARLGDGAMALAVALAVLGAAEPGAGADLALAARFAGLAEDDARAAADRLIAAGILAPGLPLRVTPPLVAAALYESIPPARRAGEHGRAARLLGEWGAPADEVAAHLLRADPGADPDSFAALRAAAARALSQGRPADAADLLRRALAEPPPRAERFATLLDLAGAEDLASRADLGEEHLREALLLAPDEEARLRATGALSLLQTRRGRLDAAADTVRRELDAARAAGASPRTLLELEVQLCVTLQLGPVDAGAEVDARLERLAPELMSAASPVERTGLATLAFRRMARGEPAAEALDPALRSLEAGLLEDPGGESGPVGLAIGVLVHAEANAEAELWIGRTLARARERGADFAVGLASFLGALLAYRRGDLAGVATGVAVSEAATSAYDTPWVDSLLLAVATDARVARGEADEAAAVLATRELDGELPPLGLFTTLRESRGRLRLLRGEADAAWADLRAAGESFDRAGLPCPGYTGWRSSLALALHGSEEPQGAADLAEEELALARRFGAARPIGIALRARGLIEGGAAGIATLEEAVAVLTESEAELERAATLVELGAALRRDGRRRDSRAPLRAGLALAEHCGAAPLAARARDELRAAGGRAGPAPNGGPPTLTASELRTCRLAAAGQSNPAIARGLFVTRATVESHLHSSYRKLGIASRGELAAALAELERAEAAGPE